MTSPKNLVCIGGGYAGLSLLHKLELLSSSPLNLTLIEPRDFLLSKFGSLRGALTGEKWADAALIPISRILTKTTHAQGRVASVSADFVTLDNGQTVPYDILVVTTGARNFSPAEPSRDVTSQEQTRAWWSSIQAKIKGAQSIAIMGTGPVAVELAGEVRNVNKSATVKILAGNHPLLGNTRPALAAWSISHMRRQLAIERITIESGDPIVSPLPPPKSELLTSSPVLEQVKIEYQSGKAETVDLLLFALGGQLSAQSFCPPEWLNSSGEILIDEFFRVQGKTNVFAFGDAAHIPHRTKLGTYALWDAPLVASNVVEVAKGKAPSKKVPTRGQFIILPLGFTRGFSDFGWWQFGNWVTSKIKGETVYGPLVWQKEFGLGKSPVG